MPFQMKLRLCGEHLTELRVASVLCALSFLANIPLLSAKITITGGEDFQKAVNACLDKIRADGDDAKSILQALEDSARDHQIKPGNGVNGTVADDSKDSRSKDDGGTGKGTTSTTEWDPTLTKPYADGVARDPCATLLHELRHALDADEGSMDYRRDPDTKIQNQELKASTAENRYRKNQGLPQRTMYGKTKLPKSAIFE